eukprot:TRINITY_DN57906_c0_g1_i1.p3 TRINITY_DN57906_c0_g1~~TRINITY_DN57906_c0_g1_i1.p3  ORF type:complete len:194 (+),score=88.81 TRINITY_DN57906_c0_g1_i1:557-1138(+)
MLGGFAETTVIDCKASRMFITKKLKGLQRTRAVDCGGGIGRVVQHLLLDLFDKTDLVEQCKPFVDKAREHLADNEKMGDFICQGMQEFAPAPNTYDLVWAQWVCGHLPDDDLAAFLQRCRKALRPGGFIVLKENNMRGEGGAGFHLDQEDGAVTRSDDLFRRVFKRAGLSVKYQMLQPHWPTYLYPVRMYALQ